MAGLVPAIHVLLTNSKKSVDARHKAGHDGGEASASEQENALGTAMTHLWPWLAIAGLGAFHGINPAMGWLFAVALAMHRKSRRVLWLSLVPIAIGHAASVAAVVFALVTLGMVVDRRLLEIAAGVFLLSWAVYFAIYGHRHRVRIGMQASMTGLGVWSFLMAMAHGAGLMLVPLIIPLCLSTSSSHEMFAAESFSIALAAVGVHIAVILAVTAAISNIVYESLGVAFLRVGWINLDRFWIAALAVTGLTLLVP
jgi:hypothetical protein